MSAVVGRPSFVDVEALTRVEGEGGLLVRVEDGRVADVELRIYEPPRFFEGFLRGRAYTEPPDLTARICGICPVAYQMSACAAIEDLCGVDVGPAITDLRRLLYCGEWIESHALHVYLLHAPDFLGYEHALAMGADHPDAIDRGLRLKKTGNDLLTVLGGRAIHPINVRVGGFYRAPIRAALTALLPDLRRARDDALATVEWVAGFEMPELEVGCELVCLDDGDHYPVLGRRVVGSSGWSIDVHDWSSAFAEHHVPWSTALHGSRRDGSHYLTGPLARYSNASSLLHPLAAGAARAAGLGPTCRNPFQSIVVRAVELVEACDHAVELIEGYQVPEPAALEVTPRAGVGHGASEAPRGLLYHRYATDAAGTITEAEIVPPTAQNLPAMEDDVRAVAASMLDGPPEEMQRRCEQAVRNHDPCISCATHFLPLRIVRVSPS